MKKEKTPGVCSVCGCTWENACRNPTHGNCWWVDDEETLCSHCYVDEIKDDPATVHPVMGKRTTERKDDA